MIFTFPREQAAHRAARPLRRARFVFALWLAIVGVVGQGVADEDKPAKAGANAKQGLKAKADWKPVNLPWGGVRVPPKFDCVVTMGIDSAWAIIQAKDKSLTITYNAGLGSSVSDDEGPKLKVGVGKSSFGKFDYFSRKEENRGLWVHVNFRKGGGSLSARISGQEQMQLVLAVARTFGREHLAPEEKKTIKQLRKLGGVRVDVPYGIASTVLVYDFKRKQLEYLMKLKSLKRLYFMGPSMQTKEAPLLDSDLIRLCELSTLHELTLPPSPKVTDAGLKNIGNLKELTRLEIDGTAITDRGLVHVVKIKRLRRLRLSGAITNQGLTHLAGLAELRELLLQATKVDGAGLLNLKSHRNLAYLNLAGQNVRSVDLKHLLPLTNLTSLVLSKTPIDDTSIVWLKQLSKLEYLDLDGTKISKKGVVELQRFLPKCMILRLTGCVD